MLFFNKNKLKYNPRRCCQCGVCLAVCPVGALRAKKTSKQYNIEIDLDKCTGCKLCTKICPAHVVCKEHIPADALETAIDLVLAYATDTKVRKFASSGGVTRTILQQSLKKGLVDSAYTLLYSQASQGEDGYLSKVEKEVQGVWVNTIPEQFRIPCSLYRPIMWGENLRKQLPDSGNVLLVGLPCQLKAAKSMLDALKPNLRVLSIAIFCRKNKNYGYSRYIHRLGGFKYKGDEYNVTYRGDGWPGKIRILHENVITVGDLFYFESCWNLSACRFCSDCINMTESDLTVTDPWGTVRQDRESYGQNMVFVWTEAGRKLLEDCRDSLAIKHIAVKDASIPFNYVEIKRKEAEVRQCSKSRLVSLKELKGIARAKLGEGFLRIIPHTSKLYSIIRSIKKHFR